MANLQHLNWKKIYREGHLKRSSSWYTKSKCSCAYQYSGLTFEANDFPPWMQTLAQGLTEHLGVDDAPLNSCNLNFYEHGGQALPFHADDEKLFETESGNITFASLSFGADRDFLFKHKFETDDLAKRMTLKQSMLLVMQGHMQNFFQHAIDRAPPVPFGEICWRYNMTFRHIGTPSKRCKLCKN